jgi:hypothetical protein
LTQPGEDFRVLCQNTRKHFDKAPPRAARRRRGKAILFTVIFLMAIYTTFKIVPAYVSEYQLHDKMQEVARFAVVNRYTPSKFAKIYSKRLKT